MLKAIVKSIQTEEIIHLVEFTFHQTTLKMLSLELNDNIKIGTKVALSIKSTHITLAKKFSGELSCSNQIKAKIDDIKNGKILSSIILNIDGDILEAIITSSAAFDMNLKKDDDVIVLIKASEISIKEVL